MNLNKIYGIKGFAEKVLEPEYMEGNPFTTEEIAEVLELAASVEKFYKCSVVLKKYGTDEALKEKCGKVLHHLMRVHARRKQIWDKQLQEDDPRFRLFQKMDNDWAECEEWKEIKETETQSKEEIMVLYTMQVYSALIANWPHKVFVYDCKSDRSESFFIPDIYERIEKNVPF